VRIYDWSSASADVHQDARWVAFDAARFAAPRMGDQLLVVGVGTHPVVGRVVKVFRVEHDCEYCGLATAYFLVELPTPPRQLSSPLAVGPVAALKTPGRVRRIDAKTVSLDARLRVYVAADLDGDGEADVLTGSARGRCPGAPIQAPPDSPCDFMGTYCVERLERVKSDWVSVERFTRPLCIMDGRREWD